MNACPRYDIYSHSLLWRSLGKSVALRFAHIRWPPFPSPTRPFFPSARQHTEGQSWTTGGSSWLHWLRSFLVHGGRGTRKRVWGREQIISGENINCDQGKHSTQQEEEKEGRERRRRRRCRGKIGSELGRRRPSRVIDALFRVGVLEAAIVFRFSLCIHFLHIILHSRWRMRICCTNQNNYNKLWQYRYH